MRLSCGDCVLSTMIQFVRPSQTEITLLEDFIHERLWGFVPKDGQHAVACGNIMWKTNMAPGMEYL